MKKNSSFSTASSKDGITENIKKFFRENLSVSLIVCALVCGYITASLLTLASTSGSSGIKYSDIKYLECVSRPFFIFTFVFSSCLILFISAVLDKIKVLYGYMGIMTVVFASSLAGMGSDFWLKFGTSTKAGATVTIGLALVVFLVFVFLAKGDKLGIGSLSISNKKALIVLGIAVGAFTLAITYFTSLRYRAYNDSTFDFGLFAQMFHQMKTTGKPFTTVERGEAFSHFGVHFSPIYYLFLPGYMIFSNPYYLFFIQALSVGAGAFAVYFICKKLDFSHIGALAFSFVYLLFPTMAGGCFYDFHENKFLAVFILFLLYFILEEKPVPIFIFALLVLFVKEDAAIYVGSIALYTLFCRKGKKMKLCGAGMIAFSVAYFFFATNMIEASGGNPMITRLSDYYNSIDGNGFIAVVKTVFYDIGYLVRMCFFATSSGEAPAAKIIFMLWMFVPLLFTPFMNEEIGVFVLLIPMGVINLMQSWIYQYDMDFQYTYGSASLVIFMAILAIASFPKEKKVKTLTSVLAVVTVFFAASAIPKMTGSLDNYKSAKKTYDSVSSMLSDYRSEFEDSSVTVSGSIMPHLYYVSDLESLGNYYKYSSSPRKTDYFVITNPNDVGKNGKGEEFLEKYYDLIDSAGFAKVYKLKNTNE